jgi:hypothetical protein
MKKQIKNTIYFWGLLVVFVFIFSFFKPVYAQTTNTPTLSAEELNKIEKKNKELENLNEKAATYEKILLLKQKQKYHHSKLFQVVVNKVSN